MGINEVRVEEKDGKVFVSTPYVPAFINELKAKTKSRKWDGLQRCWIIDVSEKGVVEELVRKHFASEEEYAEINGVKLSMSKTFIDCPSCRFMAQYAKNLGVSTSERDGIIRISTEKPEIIEFVKQKVMELLSKASSEKIYVAKIDTFSEDYIVYYDRDHEHTRKSLLFEGLAMRRFSPYGVRKSPQFHGHTAIISKYPLDYMEEVDDYVELPDTPETRIAVRELISSVEDWNALKQKLTELKSTVQVKTTEEKREPTLEELIVEKQEEIESLRHELKKKEEELKELLQKLEAQKMREKIEEMKQKIV
jgi:flagellar capping protein FliD